MARKGAFVSFLSGFCSTKHRRLCMMFRSDWTLLESAHFGQTIESSDFRAKVSKMARPVLGSRACFVDDRLPVSANGS